MHVKGKGGSLRKVILQEGETRRKNSEREKKNNPTEKQIKIQGRYILLPQK